MSNDDAMPVQKMLRRMVDKDLIVRLKHGQYQLLVGGERDELSG